MSSEITATAVPQATENSAPIEATVGSQKPVAPMAAAEERETEVQRPEETKPLDRFAPKFAALSRKEKALKEQEHSYRAERESFEKQKAEWEAQRAAASDEVSQIKSKLKDRPFDSLKEYADLDYEKLTEMQLNEQNPTLEMQMKRMRDELDSKYEKQLTDLRSQMEERENAKMEAAKQAEIQAEQQRYDAAVNDYKTNLKSAITGNEEFELIQMNDAYDLVFEVVEAYYNQHNTILEPLQAAKYVEEELELDANKIFQVKKFQGKLAPKAPEAKNQPTKQSATLTNTQSSEVPVNGAKTLNREDSIREAARKLKFIK